MQLAKSINFKNYKDAFVKGNLLTNYMNSFIITIASVILVLIFGSMASYILSRKIFKGKTIIYFYILMGMMIPIPILFIPLFKMTIYLGLFNTRSGMILIYTARSLPFAIFILTDFMNNINKEFFEAAEIDGASEFKKYLNIALPIILPSMATVIIFTFRDIWNDYFMPLIFLRDPNVQTLTVGLTKFMGQYVNQWGLLSAGLNMVIIPLIILFYFLSKQFVRGLTSGGLKM
jgi:ABC-type sugar transport system, permease component